MQKQKKGFGAGMAIVTMLVVGALGTIGWYAWQNSKDKSSKQTSAVKNMPFTVVGIDNEQHEQSDYRINGQRLTMYLGTRKSGGYSYMVDKVTKTDNKLDVYTTETTPGEACVVTQAVTYPQVTIELEQPISEDIVVHKTVKQGAC